MHREVVRHLLAIHRRDIRAAALRFEAEPSVPRADIEHALSGEVGGDGEALPALALPLQRHHAIDAFEAVIPALRVEFFAEIVLETPRLAQTRHYSIISSRSLASTCCPGCTCKALTVPLTGA